MRNHLKRARWLAILLAVLACAAIGLPKAQAQEKKPNILVIFGDDVGQSNLSVYTHGLMGYKTPHIDRIAREGMMFTDYYAENSCTAGRSSFITGQTPFRTGLSNPAACCARRPMARSRTPGR